jgi:hypothetical protein
VPHPAVVGAGVLLALLLLAELLAVPLATRLVGTRSAAASRTAS